MGLLFLLEGQGDPVLVVLPQLIQTVEIPLLRMEQVNQHRPVVQYDPAALLLAFLPGGFIAKLGQFVFQIVRQRLHLQGVAA